MPLKLLISLLFLLTACSTAKAPKQAKQPKPIVENQRALQRVTINEKMRRVALVIGNSNYAGGDSGHALKNPVNDASDLAAKLKSLEFELVNNQPLLNATQREIEQAVQTFTSSLKKGALGLFFFAGHGMQIEGENYLLPLDAEFKSIADVKHKAVRLNWVLEELRQAGNPVNFVLLDACRDNPYRGFRGSNKGLAESRAPEGSLISFATSAGKVSQDGVGQRNSPYTAGLLNALDKKGLEVMGMFREVRRAVKATTDNKQVPWESSSLTEAIYFNGQSLDNLANQQAVLEQLSQIRQQQQTTEQQLKQALKQQQQAQNTQQKQQADTALKQARATAKRIREQAQKIGVTIAPSVLEKSSNAFEKALLEQQHDFTLAQQQQEDGADYAQAKVTHTADAYLHYLKNCRSPCAYSRQAESAYKQILVLEDEKAFKQVKQSNTAQAYRHYLADCKTPCTFQQQAQRNLKAVEQVELQVAEDAKYYQQAKKIGSVPALAAYLTTCKVCLDSSKVEDDWEEQKVLQLPVKVLQVLSAKRDIHLSNVLQKKLDLVLEKERRLIAKKLAEEKAKQQAKQQAYDRIHIKAGNKLYRNNQDGTVTDMKTGLQWMRCALGQVWKNKTCLGNAKKIPFDAGAWGEDIGNITEDFSYAGYSNWRVPTIKELNTLVYCSNGKVIQYKKDGYRSRWIEGSRWCKSDSRDDYQIPAIVRQAFPNTPNNWFWSSSPNATNSSYAWPVYFSGSHGGYVSSHERTLNHFVRLVR